MVLRGWEVPLRKPRAAHRVLRGAYVLRRLAQRAGPRAHGSGRSDAAALEKGLKRFFEHRAEAAQGSCAARFLRKSGSRGDFFGIWTSRARIE